MTSKKPYFLRAIYDWLVDNHLTPHVLVNASYPGINVPQEYVSGGRIVFNISPDACRGLHLENDHIVFTARFGHKAEQVFLLPNAIMAIYAQENGEGMEFPAETIDSDLPTSIISSIPTPSVAPKRNKPNLTLIKKDEEK
ncbi:MAG: ClpXP protease specificity-enhancing factor [Legionella sp.]|nr:ClpXP protease specificity-enhancing factor [Legionella sp.]